MSVLTDEEKLALAYGGAFFDAVKSVRMRVDLMVLAMRAVDAWLASDEASALGLTCRCRDNASCSAHRE